MGLGLALTQTSACLATRSRPSADRALRSNPAIGVATLNGAKNVVPWFITQNGPVREARFKRNPNGTNDGKVHDSLRHHWPQ